MKKRLFFTFIIIMVLSMLFSSTAFAYVSSDAITTVNTNTLPNTTVLSAQIKSNTEFNKIMDYYRNGEIEYYAGAYLNTEGNLVVLVTDDNAACADKIKNISNDQNIIIIKARYSYQFLKSLMDKINQYMIENQNKAAPFSISTAALSDDKNYITVYMKDLTEEKIQLFKKSVVDSDAIVFKEELSPVQTQTNIKAGQGIKINHSGSNYTASAGYRCKRKLSGGTYEYGFVTCGHNTAVYDAVKIGSTIIGQITARKYSGSTDASFVKVTNSSYSMTNNINGTSLTLGTGYYYPLVGSTVWKSGVSSGVTSGSVTSIGATITDSDTGVVLTDCYLATYNSQGGDSGGIVYGPAGSSPLIAGIHHGASSSYAVFTDPSNILYDLSLYAY